MKTDPKWLWMMMGAAVLFSAAAVIWVARAIAAETKPASAAVGQTVHDFSAQSIDGTATPLSVYKGKALLIVNTASRCGMTPQYRGLQELYRRFGASGFEVLAFPANNFMGQEPGTDREIREFCTLKYQTTFPLFSKISVKGGDIHPLYAHLTSRPGFEGEIGWNFTKFLVAPDGRVIARFGSRQDPLSPEIVRAVESALPAPPAEARS